MVLMQTFDTVRRSRFAAPAAIAAALVLLTANEVSHQRAGAYIASSDEAVAGRVEVNRLLRVMLGAEGGQRGYLITGRAEYREPYQQAVAEIDALLTKIKLLYERSPGQRKEIEQLEELTRQKLSELETTLQLFDQGKESWRELMLTDIGREKMSDLEQLARQVAARDSVQIDISRRALATTLLLHRLGIAALVLLGLAALLLYLRQTQRVARASDEHRALLQAERDKLEAVVERRTRELTEIARHLQTAREDERSRLARELHDELGGLLTAAKLEVARLKKRVDGTGPETAERIGHLSQTLDAGIALKRRIIEGLRPSSLANLGLQRTLEIQCSEFAQRSEIRVKAEIADLTLDPERALAVYRVVQEAFTNVAKYAQASEVRVLLQRAGERVRLQVQDDGRGFDPKQVRAGSHGLAGMRFRLRSCGGELVLRSAPGQGTTIEATLPV